MRPRPTRNVFNDRWHELAYQMIPEMQSNRDNLPPVASFDADVATIGKFFDLVWNEALEAASSSIVGEIQIERIKKRLTYAK